MLVLAGPTASGKTGLSLEIGKRMAVEILSADSRQLYQEMNIGTAKPESEALKQIPHHGIDLCSPAADFNAGKFGQYGRRVIGEIMERGNLPLMVGGSGLYIQAVIEGFFPGNVKDTLIRDRLKSELNQTGLQALYARLQTSDPIYAEKIHFNDAKRIMRALEVFEITGRPFSACHQQTEKCPFETVCIGLYWPREQLVGRIHQRVDQMIESGLVQEVETLLNQGVDRELNSMNSVGYKEIAAYLNQEIDLEEAVALIKRNTRRFAKRQMTWFRKNKAIQWIDCSVTDWQEAAEHAVKMVQ